MRIVGINYACSSCGLEGHKLWRQYQTFADRVRLFCAVCSEADQGQKVDLGVPFDGSNQAAWRRPSDQIGWLVPAVPVEGEEAFWGYTSVPNEAVGWWAALPTFTDPAREIEWLRAWGLSWRFRLDYELTREAKRLGLLS